MASQRKREERERRIAVSTWIHLISDDRKLFALSKLKIWIEKLQNCQTIANNQLSFLDFLQAFQIVNQILNSSPIDQSIRAADMIWYTFMYIFSGIELLLWKVDRLTDSRTILMTPRIGAKKKVSLALQWNFSHKVSLRLIMMMEKVNNWTKWWYSVGLPLLPNNSWSFQQVNI